MDVRHRQLLVEIAIKTLYELLSLGGFQVYLNFSESFLDVEEMHIVSLVLGRVEQFHSFVEVEFGTPQDQLFACFLELVLY